jgi:murein DD-endopeptidase MepM/ murein hydrolase activator NlpD
MRNKKLAMAIAIFLAAMLIVPVLLSAVIPSAQGAPSQREIDRLRTSLNGLKADKARVRGEINTIKTLTSDVYKKKELYDQQISIIEGEIDTSSELVAAISLAMAEEYIELEEAKAREAELSAQYIRRVRYMEAMGDISYMSVLLQAESLTDLLTRYTTMRDIMASDKKLVAELIDVRENIEETVAKLASDRREQYERARELDDSYAELEELTEELYVMMSQYMADMSKLAAEERTLADAEEKMAKELAEQEAALKRFREDQQRRNNPFVGGEYGWPLPGYYTIGSPFGTRIHPIYKVPRHHNGIDIAAPRGVPIVASNAGVIATRTYASGYGNYIIIDHGGGHASLYAHMSAFASKGVGATVEKGETIGYVGTTGLSTGNHLHFEIIINGSRVNPENYLRGR